MKLSVILTSYNHEKFLEESIRSVLNQTYNDFEFIIVDDCSQDSSWDIICKYKEKYPDIITIRHEYNWGGGTVEDTVKTYATGDYIALHHSDDIWEKDKLQKQIDVLRERTDCVAVFTNAQAVNEEGQPYADTDGFYFDLFKTENRSRYEWLNYFFYHGNCLCHPSILIKKSAYEEDGFFRKGLRQVPDFVKWIQICKKHDIYVLSDKLVKFRVRDAGRNTSGMRADTQIRSTVELFLMLQEYASISDKDEFIKIFPEAAKYCDKEYFSTEYVLGRLCTEAGMPSYTRLFGVQLLYKVLNQPEHEAAMQKEYQYNKKQFCLENGKYDIFGVLPKAFEQERSIFIDTGNGFNVEERVLEKYTLGDKESFEMKVNFSLTQDQKLTALRFDPVENVLVSVQLTNITINGMLVNCKAENAINTQGGEDFFLNLDPIYSVEIPETLKEATDIEIIVTGHIKRLTDDMLSDVATTVMYGNRDALYEYQAKLIEEKELIHNYQVLLGDYEKCVQECNRELEQEKIKHQNCQEQLVMETSKLQECNRELEQEKIKHQNCQEQLVMETSKLQECQNILDAKVEEICLLQHVNELQTNELETFKSKWWFKVFTKLEKMRKA